jgi:hypothetical protein
MNSSVSAAGPTGAFSLDHFDITLFPLSLCGPFPLRPERHAFDRDRRYHDPHARRDAVFRKERPVCGLMPISLNLLGSSRYPIPAEVFYP